MNAPHAKWMKLAARGNLNVTELFDAAAALEQGGQRAAAIELYRHWLKHNARSPHGYAALFNLAVSLIANGEPDAAETAYRQAIALKPQFVEGRLNLGTLLERQGRPAEALAVWHAILEPAVKLDPRQQRGLTLQTLNNLGRLLELQADYPAAEAMLERSLRLDPQQPKVVSHWVYLRLKQCDWPVYKPLPGLSERQMLDGASALAMLSLSDDPDEQLAAARRFVEEKVDANVTPLSDPDGPGYGHQRLRIGYLSSDFCSHAVSILTAELYELHDRSQFEVYAFSWSREDNSPIRARVVKAMDHYIRIDAMSDEQAARCIREHEIDILVDLHGLTLGARPNIIAFRPAPVQLTYLGFPGSTGLPGIDYVVADEFLIPPALAAHFTEKPLYLPDTFQINDRQRQIGACPPRASVALPDDAFVFCSFNNNYKFSATLFATWMRILQRVPNSVLWLVADYDVVRDNLWRYAEEAGVARERLIFAGRAVPAEYLARYQLADLFLDTYPFNAGTTASDALWAGLPLLTCAGNTFSSRMAGSLLRAVDLPELITFNFADYEEKAVALGHDRPRIAAMKQQLRDNRMSCALFDSPRLVRNLETQLRRIARPPHGQMLPPPTPVEAIAMPTEPTAAPAEHAIDRIPVVTVSYNSPDLIASLLGSLRRYYPHNPVYVIDGSSAELAAQIAPIAAQYEGVRFIPFGYNIHHGPGMAWAINNLDLQGRVLFLDSDIEILKPGFLEALAAELQPHMYGVGEITPVNADGQPHGEGSQPYLHPACMLTNIEVVRQWPLPVKHGAPMLPPMLALAQAGASGLLGHVDWVHNDFKDNPPQRVYLRHDWQGTVRRTGGYHYDKPSATQAINTALLGFVPAHAVKVVQLGCGDGAFAKAYKQRNPVCNYTGIEPGLLAAETARAHCDFVFQQDIEVPDAQRERHLAQADCWILDGALERLRSPWDVLRAIRAGMAPHGTLVLAVRNAQHWSTQVRLNLGDCRYRADAMLHPDELRLFSRGTLLELLQQTGFRLTGGAPLIVEEPGRERFLPLLRQLAEASGNDGEQALQDALPYQYILTAVPDGAA
jgi:predicted O-linked N-acetylglucosamine transferase (SPINDLY family)